MPYGGKWHPTAQLHTDHFSKYTNICPMLNWMEMAIAFYEYNDGDGNIDYAHHSVWVPTYPITLYDGNRCVHDDHIVLIDGCLPKGTTIDFYISDAGSETSINISVDGKTKVEEYFEESQGFNMGFAMAYGEQFRKSDKKYSISLEETANEITMSAPKGVFNWCGIEVKLPEEYTVERWRKDSDWDYQLGWIAEEDFHMGEFYKKPTSSVLIGALSLDWDMTEGFHFTIYDDVTFTSDHIYAQSNRDHIESLFKAVSEKYPLWAVRTEDILVIDMDGALRFWDDATDIIKKYKGHLWGSEVTLLSREELAPYRIAGYEGENYKGHHNFNVKLLKVLQKYMDK
jgi:hypothetical protein